MNEKRGPKGPFSLAVDHSEDCDLQPGYEWRTCLCDQIDRADRPCDTCLSLMESAQKCVACRVEYVAGPTVFCVHSYEPRDRVILGVSVQYCNICEKSRDKCKEGQ